MTRYPDDDRRDVVVDREVREVRAPRRSGPLAGFLLAILAVAAAMIVWFVVSDDDDDGQIDVDVPSVDVDVDETPATG